MLKPFFQSNPCNNARSRLRRPRCPARSRTGVRGGRSTTPRWSCGALPRSLPGSAGHGEVGRRHSARAHLAAGLARIPSGRRIRTRPSRTLSWTRAQGTVRACPWASRRPPATSRPRRQRSRLAPRPPPSLRTRGVSGASCGTPHCRRRQLLQCSLRRQRRSLLLRRSPRRRHRHRRRQRPQQLPRRQRHPLLPPQQPQRQPPQPQS